MTEITSPKTTAIVGATSAIARAFASICAKSGENIILVGRDIAGLELDAADLRLRYQVEVNVVPYDASHPGSGRLLAAVLHGKEANFVVTFHGLMEGRESFGQMLQVNCNSIAELFESYADLAMQAGRKPILVATSSVAGDRGRQSNYPYGASKAALDAYLSGLRNRLWPLGIRVITVKPGFVRTKLTAGKVNPTSPLLAEPGQVAADIRAAMQGRGDVVYTRWFWRPIMFLIRSLPECVFKRLKL